MLDLVRGRDCRVIALCMDGSGLPEEAGLDGALLDPLDTQLMACLTTTEMLLGGDDYCMAFMESASAGRIPA